MFTINIKGKANPKDPKMVKLEMIIFKTGYARVTKVLNVSGPVKTGIINPKPLKAMAVPLLLRTKSCSNSRTSTKQSLRTGIMRGEFGHQSNCLTVSMKFKLAKKR